MHVVQTPCIRFVSTHVHGPVARIKPRLFLAHLIAKRIPRRSPCATCVFPLCFSWQDQVQAGCAIDRGDELLGIVPAHLLNGSHVSFELTRIIAHCCSPQFLSHGRIKHPESARQGHFMLWPFIVPASFFIFWRAHHETARRNPPHPLRDIVELKFGPCSVFIGAPIRCPPQSLVYCNLRSSRCDLCYWGDVGGLITEDEFV